MLREDEALALHIQVEPSKSVFQRPRHGQQRFEDHVRSLVRQLRVDGRLSRVTITAETAGGGKQPDVSGIEKSSLTFERPVFFCGSRPGFEPQACENNEQHDGSS